MSVKEIINSLLGRGPDSFRRNRGENREGNKGNGGRLRAVIFLPGGWPGHQEIERDY